VNSRSRTLFLLKFAVCILFSTMLASEKRDPPTRPHLLYRMGTTRRGAAGCRQSPPNPYSCTELFISKNPPFTVMIVYTRKAMDSRHPYVTTEAQIVACRVSQPPFLPVLSHQCDGLVKQVKSRAYNSKPNYSGTKAGG